MTSTAYVSLLFFAATGFAVAAEETEKPRESESPASCTCPKEGDWKVQNLEGWMNCTGPINVKRKMKEVKDEGTIWILGEESCSSLFGEASQKKDEDVIMEKTDACTYSGAINGEEDGVKMVIDVLWTLEGDDLIKGEMHSKPSFQGMFCEYYRPFEITFDKPISEEAYEKRRKKMQKKLDKIRQ